MTNSRKSSLRWVRSLGPPCWEWWWEVGQIQKLCFNHFVLFFPFSLKNKPNTSSRWYVPQNAWSLKDFLMNLSIFLSLIFLIDQSLSYFIGLKKNRRTSSVTRTSSCWTSKRRWGRRWGPLRSVTFPFARYAFYFSWLRASAQNYHNNPDCDVICVFTFCSFKVNDFACFNPGHGHGARGSWSNPSRVVDIGELPELEEGQASSGDCLISFYYLKINNFIVFFINLKGP